MLLANTAMVGAAIVCANLVIVYVRIQGALQQISRQNPETHYFVLAFKLMAFGVCPGLCLCLFGLAHVMKKNCKGTAPNGPAVGATPTRKMAPGVSGSVQG